MRTCMYCHSTAYCVAYLSYPFLPSRRLQWSRRIRRAAFKFVRVFSCRVNERGSPTPQREAQMKGDDGALQIFQRHVMSRSSLSQPEDDLVTHNMVLPQLADCYWSSVARAEKRAVARIALDSRLGSRGRPGPLSSSAPLGVWQLGGLVISGTHRPSSGFSGLAQTRSAQAGVAGPCPSRRGVCVDAPDLTSLEQVVMTLRELTKGCSRPSRTASCGRGPAGRLGSRRGNRGPSAPDWAAQRTKGRQPGVEPGTVRFHGTDGRAGAS